MLDSPETNRFGLRGWRRGLRWCVAALAGAMLLAGPQPVDEYVLKAQALVELSPYFTWPGQREGRRNFLIAVVGRSPFGAKLDAYAGGRSVRGRRIEITYVQRAAEAPTCDLVFICRSERRSAADILDWAKGKGILTVGDDEELLGRGVMVDLLAEGGLLRLYVNPAVANQEKFVVSSQLLRLAKIVDTR